MEAPLAPGKTMLSSLDRMGIVLLLIFFFKVGNTGVLFLL